MTRPALEMTLAEFEALRRKLLVTDPAQADAAAAMARLFAKARAKFPDLAMPDAPEPEPRRDP